MYKRRKVRGRPCTSIRTITISVNKDFTKGRVKNKGYGRKTVLLLDLTRLVRTHSALDTTLPLRLTSLSSLLTLTPLDEQRR